MAIQTLGQRHQALNKRTNEAVKQSVPFTEIEKLPETSDIDRLHKIDVAAKYRYVPYIISNFKSDDDLYVSRAIKKSPWLFAENQYSDVINPEYLETHLFPTISSRAVSKILLHIRLNLKDERRAEEFYEFFLTKGREDEANKWLPKCSISFIENTLDSFQGDIDLDLCKRLCERSFSIFKTIIANRKKTCWNPARYFKANMFLLKTHADEFLDLYEELPEHCFQKFNKNNTKLILNTNLKRFQEKLDKYIRHVNLEVVGKILGPKETKETIIKLSKIPSIKYWFKYQNLKSLVDTLPRDEKMDFVKDVFIDKTASKKCVQEEDCMMLCSAKPLCRSGRSRPSVNISSVYEVYRTAPFHLAFAELKKLIRTESSADERVAMFKVLISSAGNNSKNVHSLLQYYRDHHINEPEKCKANVVGTLLTSTAGYLYEERSWKLLDDILHSLEVYTEEDKFSTLDVAIRAIVCRCLLQDKPIPETVLKKFLENFNTMKKEKGNLDEVGKNVVYSFLRDNLQKKSDSAQGKGIDSKLNDVHSLKSILIQILNLLKDWNKDLTQDSKAMALIEDLIKNKSSGDDLSIIYDIEKKWRRSLFDYSLDLVQTKDAYFNALKHKPSMILDRRDKLEYVIKADSVNLCHTLKKVRIYFPDELRAEFVNIFKQKLQICRSERVGCKAVTRGICILVHRDEFNSILEEFVPQSYKVQWGEQDAVLVNIQKNLTQQMYLVRPALQFDKVLLFAKGDYLQYVLPSLLSIAYRKSQEESRQIIPQIINSAVSLQKHGVRLAVAKLNSVELTTMFNDLWTKTNNASIRAVIFNLTFEQLKNEKKTQNINALWTLLKYFVGKLTAEEDRAIYATMVHVRKIPECVRGEFCMMSYKLLKSLPPKLNCQELTKQLISEIANNIDTIDEDFVTDLLENYVNEMIEKEGHFKGLESEYGNFRDFAQLIINYVIHCKSEDLQMRRYEKILKRITEKCVSVWDSTENYKVKPKKMFDKLVDTLSHETKDMLMDKKMKYAIPTNVFRNIQSAVNNLDSEKNYKFLTKLKISIELCVSRAAIESKIPEKTEEVDKQDKYLTVSLLAKEFGTKILALVEDEIRNNFNSITLTFHKVFKDFASAWHDEYDGMFIANMLDALTEDPNNTEGYFLALLLYPKYTQDDAVLKQILKNVRQKFIESEHKEIRLYYYSNIVICED